MPDEVVNIIDAPVEVINVVETTEVINLPETGLQGPPGAASFGGFLEGPYAPRQLIVGLGIPSGCTLDEDASIAEAMVGALVGVTWDITFDGTFSNPLQATTPEINAARFGSIAFPAAGAGLPSIGVFTYTTGGTVPGRGMLRVWESATPDAIMANTALTFSGVQT